MSWRSVFSSLYENTPIYKMADRRPTAKDGPKIFVRERGRKHWLSIPWSHVDFELHVEWRHQRLAESAKKKSREAWAGRGKKKGDT